MGRGRTCAAAAVCPTWAYRPDATSGLRRGTNGGATITPLQPTNANIWRRQKGTRLPCACRVAVAAGSVQKLVVVVTGQQTQETLERWVFDVHTDKSVGPEGKVVKSPTRTPHPNPDPLSSPLPPIY